MVTAHELQSVTEQLLFWQAYDPAIKCDLSCVAYRGKAGWLLIDPIQLAEEEWPQSWKEKKPAGILLTNGNHARASEFYRQAFGCKIWASEKAQRELEVTVDHLFDVEESLLGVKILPIPGAVVGETAFLTPEGYLMLGDAVINLESHGFGLLPKKYCQDFQQNRLSLKTLLDYEFSIVTFAHGLPLRHHAKERLRALLEED